MPQMAPMWWTFILMMTMLMILLTIMLNYFNYYKIIKSESKFKTMKMNWMW